MVGEPFLGASRVVAIPITKKIGILITHSLRGITSSPSTPPEHFSRSSIMTMIG
jgi:hypothetical protein